MFLNAKKGQKCLYLNPTNYLFTQRAVTFGAFPLPAHPDDDCRLESVSNREVCTADQLTKVFAGNVVVSREVRQQVLGEGESPRLLHPLPRLVLYRLQVVGRLNEVHPRVMVQIQQAANPYFCAISCSKLGSYVLKYFLFLISVSHVEFW